MHGSKTETTRWVRTAADLAAFRDHELTPDRLLAALKAHGAAMLGLDPGVGKSVVVDKTLARVRETGEYDLIVYLTAQTRTLLERPVVREYLALADDDRRTSDLLLLEPRPRRLCGALDAEWKRMEALGCSALGRQTVCVRCPSQGTCAWPSQLGKEVLRGKRVVAGTQAYLSQVPDLVARLKKGTGASHALVVLDESAFLDQGMRVTLQLFDVKRNLDAVRAVLASGTGGRTLHRWAEILESVVSPDVSLKEMPLPPRLNQALCAEVQEAGLRLHPADFRFVLFAVEGLCRSTRWRETGAVSFIRRPALKGHHHLVLAAGIPVEVARQRLKDDGLREVFPGTRFLNEGTRVFNLRSGLGAAVNFEKNAPQILFAVAQLIVGLATENKRAVVVSRKRFAQSAAAALERYLRELSAKPYRAVVNPTAADIADALVVPVISYGSVGTNAYEDFDAALAINSYNARPDVLDQRLNDTHRPAEEVRVGVDTTAGRRKARARGYFPRLQGFDGLAQGYQAHLEAGVAVQALGRVRFATRPRLVLFFQSGGVPYPLEREFTSLQQLRDHFGLASHRQWTAHGTAERARALAAGGMTRHQVAAALGVSERTISRSRAFAGQGDTKSN